jgi:superfamily II DNA or RNA helicase
MSSVEAVALVQQAITDNTITGDECHHVSAFSFEQVLNQVKAKHVLGSTATSVRKDGHDFANSSISIKEWKNKQVKSYLYKTTCGNQVDN